MARRPDRERQRLVLVGLALFAGFALVGTALASSVAGALGAWTGHRPVALRIVGWLQAGLPWLVITVLALIPSHPLRRTWVVVALTVWLTSNAIYVPGRGSDALRRHFGRHYPDGRQLVVGVGVGLASALAGAVLMIVTLPITRRPRPHDPLGRRRVMLCAFLLAPVAGLVLIVTSRG